MTENGTKTGRSGDLSLLQERIGHPFCNPALLEEALTHRSYLNESPDRSLRDNERLEFFGDAVLSLFISQLLFAGFPEMREGELSRLRASMVDEATLARLATEYGIGDCLRLGKGEAQSGGRLKPSILADAYEAVLAAVYLDGGADAVSPIVERHFRLCVLSVTAKGASRDSKSELQELMQARGDGQPRYLLTGSSGPDHNRTFFVSLYIGDEMIGEGSGRSKKEAEQEAARRGLENISGEVPSVKG